MSRTRALRPTDQGSTAQGTTGQGTTGQGTTGRGPVIADTLVIAGWFLVSGVVGALVWWQVTELPVVTSDGGTPVVEPGELVKQVGIDAWFAVIALVGGLLGGIVLTAWRRRDPMMSVVMVAVGAALAGWLMKWLGGLLGPAAEKQALASLVDGSSVPMQLTLHAPGVLWLWPLAAMVGTTAWLWIIANPEQERS